MELLDWKVSLSLVPCLQITNYNRKVKVDMRVMTGSFMARTLWHLQWDWWLLADHRLSTLWNDWLPYSRPGKLSHQLPLPFLFVMARTSPCEYSIFKRSASNSLKMRCVVIKSVFGEAFRIHRNNFLGNPPNLWVVVSLPLRSSTLIFGGPLYTLYICYLYISFLRLFLIVYSSLCLFDPRLLCLSSLGGSS